MHNRQIVAAQVQVVVVVVVAVMVIVVVVVVAAAVVADPAEGHAYAMTALVQNRTVQAVVHNAPMVRLP